MQLPRDTFGVDIDPIDLCGGHDRTNMIRA